MNAENRDNDTVLLPRPEVVEFLDRVRARFADLTEEERDDLLGGLEADVLDLVEDRGVGALGDPVAYADELRAAAGVGPFDPARRDGRGWAPDRVGELVSLPLDRVGASVGRLLDWLPFGLGQVLRAARPAWWAFRAWIAVMLVDRTLITGDNFDVPYLPTEQAGVGAVLLGIAIVLSVQIGRGKLWPGTPQAHARLVLLALNVFAVALVPHTFDRVQREYTHIYEVRWGGTGQAVEPGVRSGPRFFCNLQTYDAAGNPLTGVQLLGPDGKPFDVHCEDEWRESGPSVLAFTPWVMGDVERWNVFPQGEIFGGDETLPTPARPTVPAVTHPAAPTSAAVTEGEGGGEPNNDEKGGSAKDNGEKHGKGGKDNP